MRLPSARQVETALPYSPLPLARWFAQRFMPHHVAELFLGGRGSVVTVRDRATVVPMNLTGPVTLGDLIRDGKLLWLLCCDCGREVDVPPATIPLAADFPVPHVRRPMKCSACGSRNIDSRPELYPGGIAAQRAKFRTT